MKNKQMKQMKIKFFITSIALIFTFSSINAQIKILSDGSATVLGSFYTGGIRLGA